MPHKCKATGCAANVSDQYGMCRKHWFSVPKALRDAIWNTEGVARARHWAEAIKAVEEKEGVTSQGELL